VWIDDDGIVRRVRTEGSGDLALTLTAELYDLGEPVTITAPPADQVTPFDLGALEELVGKLPR
jgi:hypothetical protein